MDNDRIGPKYIDVVVLCGGEGKRLRPVINKRPKPMAEINSQPFLDILFGHMTGFGFERFILCICHKADFIRKYYERKKRPFDILFSEENAPMGTAGAIKNAEPLIKSNPFLVLNGDSFCGIEMNEFVDFHMRKKALFSMVLSVAGDAGDYGSVSVDKEGKIMRYNEKVSLGSSRTLVNAGIYLLDKAIFSEIPENRKSSIEYEVFPRIINRDFYGYVTEERLIDIGTPERFKEAQCFFKKVLESGDERKKKN